jgi:hypothetical protein
VVVGVLAMAAAVLTKYVPILLVPVLLGHLWRAADDKRRCPGGSAGGSCRCGRGGHSVRPTGPDKRPSPA